MYSLRVSPDLPIRDCLPFYCGVLGLSALGAFLDAAGALALVPILFSLGFLFIFLPFVLQILNPLAWGVASGVALVAKFLFWMGVVGAVAGVPLGLLVPDQGGWAAASTGARVALGSNVFLGIWARHAHG